MSDSNLVLLLVILATTTALLVVGYCCEQLGERAGYQHGLDDVAALARTGSRSIGAEFFRPGIGTDRIVVDHPRPALYDWQHDAPDDAPRPRTSSANVVQLHDRPRRRAR